MKGRVCVKKMGELLSNETCLIESCAGYQSGYCSRMQKKEKCTINSSALVCVGKVTRTRDSKRAHF